MATDRGSGDARHIRTLFCVGTLAGLTDGQLLERFTTRDGAEAELAFAIIVERHGPMVLRVCRSILDDPHDAEDAFQATFLVLVRRVGSIRKRDSVASWLHGVAYRTASCARTDEARRRRHERRAAEFAVRSDTEGMRDDPGLVLYEELEKLPGRYREPIVLCDLEGLTHEQAAHQLDLPVGTVKSRLTRGRGRLRDRLRRRGLAPSIGASGAMLAAETASAEVTRRLAGSAVRAAMWFAARDGSVAGEVPATVAALTGKVLRAMFRSRLLKATLLASIAGSVAIGTGMILVRQSRALGAPPHAAPAVGVVGSAVDGLVPVRLRPDFEDLVDAAGLDIYKYRVNILEGQHFSVILRELEGPDSPARILHRGSFKAGPRAGTIVISFMRTDRKLGGVLFDRNETECDYRVSCDGCSPGGDYERIPLPLSGKRYAGIWATITNMSNLSEKERKSLSKADSEHSRGVTAHLLTKTATETETESFPATEADHYPRAEVVIVLDR